MSTETKIVKEKRFKVMPNGAPNTNLYRLCSYQNPKTRQFTWIDTFDRIHVGEAQPETGIKQHVFNSNFPFYEIIIPENSLEAPRKKMEQMIAWYKSWPLCGRLLPDGTVDSYPHENHKTEFAHIYANGANAKEALFPSLQPLVYLDQEEVQSLTLKDRRFERTLAIAMNAVSGKKDELIKIAYMLGINPHAMDADDIEFAIDEAVNNGDRGNEFLRIVQEQEYNDAYTYAVNVGITLGFIVLNEDGFYQYNSNPISRKIPNVVAHMREKEYDFNALVSDLAARSVIIDKSAKKKVVRNNTSSKTDSEGLAVGSTGTALDDTV